MYTCVSLLLGPHDISNTSHYHELIIVNLLPFRTDTRRTRVGGNASSFFYSSFSALFLSSFLNRDDIIRILLLQYHLRRLVISPLPPLCSAQQQYLSCYADNHSDDV